MLTSSELLNIICTEATEFGGIQELPGHKHGAKHSFHSQKRRARGPGNVGGGVRPSNSEAVDYPLRLVRMKDGSLIWKD